MRYRFVGGQDVPEWILAEVSVLSRISCVRLKLICRQVIYEQCGVSLDFDKLSKLVPKDSGFSASDIKATVAAIAFVITNATRYGIDHDVLNAELQQLGLPKENSDGVSRPYRIHRDKLRAQAAADSLRLPRLLSVSVRSDTICASSACGSLLAPSGSTGSSVAAAARPVAVYQVSLGLTHTASSARARAAADGPPTPLLSSHAAASALQGEGRSAGAGAQTRRGATAAATAAATFDADAAMALAALNAQPLVVTPRPNPGVTASTAAAPASQSATAPAATAHFTVSAENAVALLAELRVARKALAAVTAAASAPLAAASK